MSFEVEDIDEAMTELRKDFPLHPEKPQVNPVGDKLFYIDKDNILNIETEFKEPKKH